MLAWMHDADVVRFMQANFQSKTLEDCEAFIRASEDTTKSLHLAVADDHDEYMGTVSLKDINRELGCAEFAITMRKEAMGKGLAAFGMDAILRRAFADEHLKMVYWYVRPENARAVRFYDKHGYPRQDAAPAVVPAELAGQAGIIWYAVTEKDLHEC